MIDKYDKAITFSDIFRHDRIYNTRPSFTPFGVVPGTAGEWNDRQGSILCISNCIKSIQPEGFFTSTGEDLIRSAGVPYAGRDSALLYHSGEEYRSILRSVPERSLIVDHPHPEGEIRSSAYMVSKDLCDQLIDKAHIAKWVPAYLLPERYVAARKDAHKAAAPLLKKGGRCVLKSTGPFPCGGGAGVEYVSAPDRLSSALEKLAGQGDVVVECWLPAPVSFCLNFVVSEKNPGVPLFIGAAEQIIVDCVKYSGSWSDPSVLPDAHLIESCMNIAKNAASDGYRGILGIDALVQADGKPWVVDINPRVNGSTPMLFLAPFLRGKAGGAAVLRSHVFYLKEKHIPAAIHTLIKERRLFPVRLFEYPEGGPYVYKCGAIAADESKEEVVKMFDFMRAAGIKV